MCNLLKREMSNTNLLSMYQYPSFPDEIVCREKAKKGCDVCQGWDAGHDFCDYCLRCDACDIWCRDNPCTQKLILSLLKSVHVTAVILTSDAISWQADLISNIQYPLFMYVYLQLI